ncbi:PulJ/GspJ family protein [Bowmanella denitrificans]|uniref:PulJ/GspJ family protein n=1 Tax=Bowmanella denitrificans TaxID=366582 RepID=UPI000C9B45C4|nr:prepilin-type N-terminal cleavage/methylation domain-containing protein [Bowmanella denitrificans]
MRSRQTTEGADLLCRSGQGFTLIEMLVVLVILSMTTALLAQGLQSTWQNFQRLGAKDLSQSSANLPVDWFEQSIRAALMYHPLKANAVGTSQRFEFVSAARPDDSLHIPAPMVWQLVPGESGWLLQWQALGQPGSAVTVQRFSDNAVFDYLLDTQWQNDFSSQQARLPDAVRVRVAGKVWALAVPGRPVQADIPPELPIFGEYDFGG